MVWEKENSSSSEDDDYYDENDDENTLLESEKKIKKELAEIPFGQLLKLKEQMGQKAFQSTIKKSRTLPDSSSSIRTAKSKEELGKEAHQQPRKKSNPLEISSKRPVKVLRNVFASDMAKARDPRFDSRAGEFSRDKYKKHFSFIQDYQDSEMKEMESKISRKRDVDGRKLDREEVDELKALLVSTKSKMAGERKKEKEIEILRHHKKKEREKMMMTTSKGDQPKNPFYLKKSEIKKMSLIDKFNDIKDRRGDQADRVLEKLMEKRRKKNAMKKQKLMPFPKRRSQEEH